jgi:hypothetical protein
MRVYIWEWIEELTDSYHSGGGLSGGGLVIIAKSLISARKMAIASDDTALKHGWEQKPDRSILAAGRKLKAEVLVFPGCC